MSKDKLNRYERAFRYVRDIAQQHCESYTQFCLRTDVLVEAIKKAAKYDELNKIYHKYETMESADLNAERLENQYKFGLEVLKLSEENQESNHTLSECVKMWEDRGWKVDEDGYFKTINFIKGDRGICFDIDEKYYFTFRTSLKYNSFDIDVELHNLIHKTIKALEKNNETK